MNDILNDEKKIQEMQLKLAMKKDSERIRKRLLDISTKDEITPEDLRVTIHSVCADPTEGNIELARHVADMICRQSWDIHSHVQGDPCG